MNQITTRALLLAPCLAIGCTATLGDLSNARVSREACVNFADSDSALETIRDAHLIFDDMAAHADQMTVVSMLGDRIGPDGEVVPGPRILRARAVFLPTVTGMLETPFEVNRDTLLCDIPLGEPRTGRTVDVVIPGFVPPYGGGNGGPFDIDFWSDLTKDGVRAPAALDSDHSWIRPVCDDGEVYFLHNTGFDPIAEAETNGGRFGVRLDQVAFLGNLVIDRGFTRGQEAMLVEVLRRAPVAISVQRRGITVGYLRTALICQPNMVDVGINGIIDGGEEHQISVHWDVGRDGRYTEGCDPSCTFTARADSNLQLDIMAASASSTCLVPGGLALCAGE